MNIKDFFKNKQIFKRTTKFKCCPELQDKPYLNELIYSWGQVYLFIGLNDTWDDTFYIMVDSSGVIHYNSAVGELGIPLIDYMDEESYKKFKKYFIANLKYQRDWRIKFDNRVYLPESSRTNVVEYYKQDGMPIIKERKTNVEDMGGCHLTKEERKTIRKDFWKYLWHMLGFHHICERNYVYDEYKLDNDESMMGCDPNGVLIGRCDVCNRGIQINPGWLANNSIWYKHKWLGKLCKPFIQFFDMYKRAK